MKRVVAGIILFGLVALAVPSAVAANGGTLEPGMPRLVITVVCTVYGEYLDDAVTALELGTGMNLGQYMSDCNINTEYVEATPSPATSVAIPQGALFPQCKDTNECFVPYTVIVEAGTDVTWTNSDTVLHTVTGDMPNPDGQFDRWVLPGEEFTFTFDTPGTYPYHCSVHPWANGVVVVEPRSAAPPVAEQDTATEPAVKPEPPNVQQAYDAVDTNIALYMANGTDAFGTITDRSKADPDPAIVTYVIDVERRVIVAHSENPAYIQLPVEPLLAKASMPIDVLLAILDEHDEGVWLSYPFPDTQGNIVRYDRGWLKMYDGYVFGARYALNQTERIQSVVDEMIRLYNLNPDTAFDTISSFNSSDDNYPFVLDPDTVKVVAHGANSSRVGATSKLLTNSSVSLETFQGMQQGEGVWTDYVFVRPQTGEEALKRSWVMMHDGYLFGSGYYPMQ